MESMYPEVIIQSSKSGMYAVSFCQDVHRAIHWANTVEDCKAFCQACGFRVMRVEG